MQTCKKKVKAIPCNRPWRPIGLWDVEAPAFSRQSAHIWRWGCQPYALATFYSPGRFQVLISVRCWVDPRAIVQLEGLGQLKNPVTSSGIEPATTDYVRGWHTRIVIRILTPVRQSPFRNTLLFPLPNALPSVKRTFTRMKGHTAWVSSEEGTFVSAFFSAFSFTFCTGTGACKCLQSTSRFDNAKPIGQIYSYIKDVRGCAWNSIAFLNWNRDQGYTSQCSVVDRQTDRQTDSVVKYLDAGEMLSRAPASRHRQLQCIASPPAQSTATLRSKRYFGGRLRWSTIFPEKLIVAHLIKFPVLYEVHSPLDLLFEPVACLA
jgi:hypothetical protein